jgi:competence protein ComEC
VDNASVVLRVVYGDVSFLLTGDIFVEGESGLVQRDAELDSDVLKVAHHGSRSSSSPPFLEAVSPAVAVVSAGSDNRYGHPHAETMEALRCHVDDARIFLTGESGSIEFVTDGARLEVRTER